MNHKNICIPSRSNSHDALELIQELHSDVLGVKNN